MTRRLLAVIVAIASLSSAVAQTAEDELSPVVRPAISQHLRQTGRVDLQQDTRLEALIGTTPRAYYGSPRKAATPGYIYMAGYRVRVFSGNNQTESKATAYAIERQMHEQTPDIETYVVFKTPNWRLLVGNYRTSEEAIAALRKLKKAFPTLGREMFVVKDEIEIKTDD